MAVFYLNATRYATHCLQQYYASNEIKKRRKYNNNVMVEQHGCLTPLVYSGKESMSRECKKFYSVLPEMIARILHHIVWVTTNISFSLMSSILLCIRGSGGKNWALESRRNERWKWHQNERIIINIARTKKYQQ